MNPETAALLTELHLAAARASGALIEELAAIDPAAVHATDKAIATGVAGLALHMNLDTGRVELRLVVAGEERALVAHVPGEPIKPN